MRLLRFRTTCPGLGDRICFLSACRIYARRHLEDSVQIIALPEVVNRYRDKLVRIDAANAGTVMKINPGEYQRRSNSAGVVNYVGSYLRAMGDDPLPCCPELPAIPRPENLPRRYIAFQPWAKWARNPDWRMIRAMLDTVDERIPIVLVGMPNTDWRMFGDYRITPSWLKNDVLQFLGVVKYAKFVLSPRSAAAHAAAAYGKPAIVWGPDDGENWHLDYVGWHKTLVIYGQDGQAKIGLRDALVRIESEVDQ